MTADIPRRISSGIEGLDTILDGGLLEGRSYLVGGPSGTGKSMLGLHFLVAGVECDETCLFINLEESVQEIEANAAAVGLDTAGIEFLDLSPDAEVFTGGQQYDVFAPDEVEGEEIVGVIADRIAELEPDRVFVDPLSHLRSLSADDYQFRKQANSAMRFVKDLGGTVLFTTQPTTAATDEDLQFLADGAIELDRTGAGRTVAVPKFRGSSSRPGVHTVRIGQGGMRVYPAMTPGAHGRDFEATPLTSGVPAIDDLLGGGIERGSITILSGPSGVGKTTLGAQFMKAAAERDERSVMYMFEESTRTFIQRSTAVDIPVDQMVDRGSLHIEEVEALESTPAEFAAMVRAEVESRDAQVVMIDGIDGYRLSLQGEEGRLERELNSLGRYLKNMGVAVILVDTVEGVTGEFHPTNEGVSYLADNIVFLRYLEIQGELRKAIGVLKKRTSDFERTLREFAITGEGLIVGEPLSGLRGILTGMPEFAESRGDTTEAPGGRPPAE